MLNRTMKLLNRDEESERLDRLARRRDGGFAVVHGRRRVGKTRLLLEWCARHGGIYDTVADQSAPVIQRRYFAGVVAERLPGFADAEFPDWRSLLARLARDAGTERWRGPIVFDEFPPGVERPPGFASDRAGGPGLVRTRHRRAAPNHPGLQRPGVDRPRNPAR